MSLVKKLAVVLLGLLLLVSVAGANVTTTVDRTALNEEFVNESISEEGGYAQMRNVTLDFATDQVANVSAAQSDELPPSLRQEVNTTDIVRDAVTTAYVRNQSRQNIADFYAFMNGETETLNLSVNLVSLKASLAETVADQVSDVRTASLVDEFAPQGDQIPVNVSGDRFSRMRSNESGYQTVRENFREEVRQEAIDRLVEEAYNTRDEDTLLALVIEDYDPRDYTEAEKDQLVIDRESEIKTALRQEIEERESDRVREEFNNRLSERRDDAKQRVQTETREATSQYTDNVTRAAIDLQYAVIDGLAGNDTDYEEFNQRVTNAEDDLAAEAQRLARDRIEQEVPDNISATDNISDAQRDQLNRLPGVVSQVRTASTILPIVALVLFGLIALISRSIATTGLTAGTALSLAGLGTYIGVMVGESAVTTAIEEAVSGENLAGVRELAIGVIEQMLGALGSQSLLILGGGIVLLAIGLADKFGFLDGVKPGGDGGGQAAAAGAGGAAGGAGGTDGTEQRDPLEDNAGQAAGAGAAGGAAGAAGGQGPGQPGQGQPEQGQPPHGPGQSGQPGQGPGQPGQPGQEPPQGGPAPGPDPSIDQGAGEGAAGTEDVGEEAEGGDTAGESDAGDETEPESESVDEDSEQPAESGDAGAEDATADDDTAETDSADASEDDAGSDVTETEESGDDADETTDE